MSHSAFLETFITEAFEWTREWERLCLHLGPESPPSDIDHIFRLAHSLKGSAHSAGLDDFADFVHVAESLIELVRSKTLLLSEEIRVCLLDTHMDIEKWLGSIQQGQTESPKVDETKARLEALCHRTAPHVIPPKTSASEPSKPNEAES